MTLGKQGFSMWHAESRHAVRRGGGHLAAKGIALLLAALAGGFFCGCGAARPSKYYELTVPSDVNVGQAVDPSSVRLLLGDLSASHLYRDDRLVYGRGREEMGTYEYQRWVEPPPEMIEEVLLRELRTSGRYSAVHVRRSNATGDFLLGGRLYDFKELSGSPLVARVTLELEMRDVKSGETVWTHYYTHDEPVSKKDVSAVVLALDKNVQRGIKEIVASLDQYFAAHPVK
jgi:ABC-type uncharacterized transport system auxiliary subunit